MSEIFSCFPELLLLCELLPILSDQVGSLSQEWALLSHTYTSEVLNLLPQIPNPSLSVFAIDTRYFHTICFASFSLEMWCHDFLTGTSLLPPAEATHLHASAFQCVHKELPQLPYLKVKAVRQWRSEKGRCREYLLPTKAGWCSPAHSAGGWGSSQTCWPQELWIPLAPGDLDYLELMTSALCWTALLENLHLSHL